MLVGLYPRVSTQEQAKEGYSIGEQIERLNKYCEAMGWTVYKTYTDAGYSGGNTDRPGLQQMIKDVKAGKLDKIVVYKLDRLSRSQLDTLYLIEKVFLANDTDFVSMSENFDTSTPFGRAMIGILAVFAQLEREQIKERMGLGKEARAKEGKWHGGATEPIGYDYNPIDELLHINQFERMQIVELYDLFLRGVPLRAVEKMFLNKGYKHKHGVWDPKTMRRVMANKLYIGYIKHNDQWFKGLQDPIIRDETFNKAQRLLKERHEQYAKTGVKPGAQTTYLGGLLYCKHCGGKYAKDRQIMRGGKPPKTMYICNSRSKRVKKMIKDPNCKNKRWSMEELDDIVFNEIKKLAMDPEYISTIKEVAPSDNKEIDKIVTLKKEIKKIDDQVSRLMDLYAVGNIEIDSVTAKIEPLNETKQKLETELESLTVDAPKLTEEEALEILSTFSEVLETGDFNEIRLIIDTLIDHIVIDNDDVYIHWNFI